MAIYGWTIRMIQSLQTDNIFSLVYFIIPTFFQLSEKIQAATGLTLSDITWKPIPELNALVKSKTNSKEIKNDISALRRRMRNCKSAANTRRKKEEEAENLEQANESIRRDHIRYE